MGDYVEGLSVELAMLIEEVLGKARPENPPEPAKPRITCVINFDYAIGDTEGMVDALREAGYYAVPKGLYPVTSVLCRAEGSTPIIDILNTVSGVLDKNTGTALVAVRGGKIWIWPKRPFTDTNTKSWRYVTE